MTVLQFSRDEELKEAGREEERVSGIQNMAELCLQFKQAYDDAKTTIIKKYPDTDEELIESIVAEVYGISSVEVK